MFIEKLGTAKVPAAFAMKDKVDAYLEKFGVKGLSDKVLQLVTKFMPNHLPKRMNVFVICMNIIWLFRLKIKMSSKLKAF